MDRTSTPAALRGCYVISLRPVGGHDGVRRAAAAYGARMLALSPWRLEACDNAQARQALRAALDAPAAIFTSPFAARAAAALASLAPANGQLRLAVGAGTAAALRRAGVAQVQSPTRMDSEGLLALPALDQVAGLEIGLVTAPGGRGQIAAELSARGARMLRANVYQRVPVAPHAGALARLRALQAPLVLPVSSGEALERTMTALPADVATRLRGALAVAASQRLAGLAQALGFTRVIVASDARPRSLLEAAAHGCTPRQRRGR